MLVCSVSLRPPRSGITADIIEVAAALDDSGSGQVIFATLVDDPASVRETIDAYLGQTMVEAASAAAVVTAGLVYAASVVEAVTAASAQDTSVAVVSSRAGMVGSVMVNSDGTARQANADGTMVNL